ncbi:hypothetical protein [Paracidovorax cattleyae]|uniref:hypothetical protein n=1 Tax=Paracidovorax cattleyae TaxID=80868 RepID=UPI00116004AD|nr:hypothetical protein [Paracidovorax cattleyae]
MLEGLCSGTHGGHAVPVLGDGIRCGEAARALLLVHTQFDRQACHLGFNPQIAFEIGEQGMIVRQFSCSLPSASIHCRDAHYRL